MPIPYGRTAIPTSLMIAFVFGFTVLAIFNLTNFFTLTNFGAFAAIAWLLLVAAVVWMFIHEDGVDKLLIDLLGLYARKHFVEAEADETGAVVLCFGYEGFGRKRYYLRVEATKIVSVHWNTGQATDMAGRDMRDWMVWLWYLDPDKPERSTEFSALANHDLYQVGPTGPRKKTEPIGLAFIEFLRSVGIDMVATEKDTEFNVRGKSLPSVRSNP